jgi:APA family basic amino acid/polyamine antiporter
MAGSTSQLKRVLGVGSGIAVTVGLVVGSGIFRTPGLVAQELGDPLWIMAAWLAGGLVALGGSLVYAELATLMPRAGGEYAFIRATYGPLLGFMYGWAYVVVIVALGNAGVAVIFGEYLTRLAGLPHGAEGLIGAVTVILLTLTNLAGLRVAAGLMNALTLIKLAALLAIAAAAFAVGGASSSPPPTSAPTGAPALLLGLAVAFQSVLWTYDGWGDATKLAEEVRRPDHSLPRILVGGALLVIALYLLLNGAFLWALHPADMAASKLVAADVAGRVLGRGGELFVTVLACLSVFGYLNAALMAMPRVPFAMARDGLAFRVLARANAAGTPAAAVLSLGVVTAVLALIGSFERILAVYTFVGMLMWSPVFLAVIVLRRRRPDAPRAFLLPGYPWTALAMLAVYLGVATAVAVSSPTDALLGVGLVAPALPVYLLLRTSRRHR